MGACLALASSACSQGAPAAQVEFFIAPDGSDRNAGTKDAPFLTLERARRAVRSLKREKRLPPGGVTVWLRGGTYYRAKSFELTPLDSGRKNAPITYSAFPGEQVRLVGGRQITGFEPVDDPAVLARMDPACAGKVLQADLRAQGITDFGELTPRGFGRPTRPAHLELFFRDEPMTLARWPNEGWVEIAAVPEGEGRFCYAGDRPARWTRAEDLWLHGYWTWDWAESYEKVQSIDLEAKEMRTRPPHGVYGYKAGKRYYALNLLEELDQPGEWYLDRASGILYFWPPAPIESGRAVVSLLEKPLISLRKASHIIIRGLTLECARGCGIDIKDGTGNLVAGCTLRNLGTLAVSIAGGKENGVLSCDIYHTGEGGIVLSGGDRRTLTPAGHFATNNHIWDFSRWVRTYRPAVLVQGVGNRIEHNLIHDAPHSAIILGGNEHLIEFNEIHHVCMETSDAGAFYMGRDFTERGTVLRYNYFHHLGRGDVQAIYFDDCSSGNTAFGNICVEAGRGVLIGGGRDHLIENNVFVNCTPAVHVDARGMGWASFWFDGRDSTLMDRLKAVNHDQPPYSERYPELATLLEDEPAMPKNNRIVRNVWVGGRWLDLRDGLTEQIVQVKDNFTAGDPGFVDPEHGDYQLRPDSPVWKLGFQRIPTEHIGLYPDEYRENLGR